MSDDFDPNVYDPETGEWLGVMAMVDDDTAALVDGDGRIITVAAMHRDPETGEAVGYEPLDPGEFAVDGGDDDPRLAELQANIAQLEERIDNPPPSPVQQYRQGPDPSEVWASGIGRELENLETALGRQLSDAEAHRILTDHHADFTAGVQADVFKSAAATGLHNMDTHEGRVAWGAERWADATRDAGDDFDEQPKPSHESYDLDKPEQRAAYHADRLNGAEVEGLEYRTSELATDTEGMD